LACQARKSSRAPHRARRRDGTEQMSHFAARAGQWSRRYPKSADQVQRTEGKSLEILEPRARRGAKRKSTVQGRSSMLMMPLHSERHTDQLLMSKCRRCGIALWKQVAQIHRKRRCSTHVRNGAASINGNDTRSARRRLLYAVAEPSATLPEPPNPRRTSVRSLLEDGLFLRPRHQKRQSANTATIRY
jgi:hypothetical protein